MFKGSSAHNQAVSKAAFTKKSALKKHTPSHKTEEVQTNMPTVNARKFPTRPIDSFQSVDEDWAKSPSYNTIRKGDVDASKNTLSNFEKYYKGRGTPYQFSRKEIAAIKLSMQNKNLSKDEKTVLAQIVNMGNSGRWVFSDSGVSILGGSGSYRTIPQSNKPTIMKDGSRGNKFNVSDLKDYVNNAVSNVYSNPQQKMEWNETTMKNLHDAARSGHFNNDPGALEFIKFHTNNTPTDKGIEITYDNTRYTDMYNDRGHEGEGGDKIKGNYSQNSWRINDSDGRGAYTDKRGNLVNTGEFNSQYRNRGKFGGYADKLFNVANSQGGTANVDLQEMQDLNRGGGPTGRFDENNLTKGQEYFKNRYPGFGELDDNEKKQVIEQYFPESGKGPTGAPGSGVLGQSGGPGLRTGKDKKITLDPIKPKEIKGKKPRTTTSSGQPNFSANKLEKGMGETNVGKDKQKFPTQQRRRLKQSGQPSLETIKPSEFNVKNNVDLEMGKNKENFLKQSTDKLKAKSKENKKQREQEERQAKLDKKRELNYNPQTTASNNTNNRRRRGNAKGGGGGDFGSRTKEFLDNTIGSLFKGGGGGGNKLLPSTMAKKGKYNKGKKKK